MPTPVRIETASKTGSACAAHTRLRGGDTRGERFLRVGAVIVSTARMTATAEPLIEPTERAPSLSDGRYTLGEIIGRGSAGTVRVAHDAKLDREVAIKSLDLHADAKARARFEREARAAGAIGHPNIVQILDICELSDGTPCVVMERLRGETLADRIAREGPLPLLDVIDLALELLEALEAAHAVGIVHRDVKPANVMLALLPTGRTSLKLLDFGTLGLLEADAARLTAAGVVVGSPAYVPPECLREGASRSDVRCDVYAAGLSIYEALAGKPAFEAPSPVALRARILTKSPEALAAIRTDVPASLVAHLERATDRDPSRRFPSARAFADALSAARTLLGAPAMDPPPMVGVPRGDSSESDPEPDPLTHSQERDAQPRAPTSTLSPSTMIGGRYRLLRPIGSGGMSDVYEATDEHIARRVAVKVARGGVDIDRIIFARIEREARAAASLGHPNVVGVLDLGIDATNGAYLVMELLAGESLLARLRRKGGLPAAEAIDITLQVLDGLAVAHAAGMTHRDVKPANIFLVPLASGAHLVKVLDFGIVKLREELAGPKLTHRGTAIGTPAYMPPEQLRMEGVDARADVYAVAVTLYEMLTGALPASDTLPFGRPMILPPLHASAIGNEGLAKVLAQAMSSDPARRYPHAGAMRDALVQLKPTGRPTAMAIHVNAPPATAIAAPQLERSHLETLPEIRAQEARVGARTMARLGLGGSSPRAWIAALALVALALVILAIVVARRESETADAPVVADPDEAPTTAVLELPPEPPTTTTTGPTVAHDPPETRIPLALDPPPTELPTALDPPPTSSAPPATTTASRSTSPRGGEISRVVSTTPATMTTTTGEGATADPPSDEPVALPGILNPFE